MTNFRNNVTLQQNLNQLQLGNLFERYPHNIQSFNKLLSIVQNIPHNYRLLKLYRNFFFSIMDKNYRSDYLNIVANVINLTLEISKHQLLWRYVNIQYILDN